MTPKRTPKHRRQQSSDPPLRRSNRLSERSANILQPPPLPRGLSVLSTESESSSGLVTLESQAKSRIATYQPANRKDESKLVASLNAMMDWLPKGGRDSVAGDIIKATTNDELWQVYHNLLTGLAVPMKAISAISSITSSPFPQRRNNSEVVAGIIDQPQTREAGFREACFKRDAYRCVITGDMDTDYFMEIDQPAGIHHGPCVRAHIIPFAYASWKASSGTKDTSSQWEILFRCFPAVRQRGMVPERINDPSNGLCLKDWMHTRFGKFHIALKGTGTPNKYEIKTFKRFPTSESTFLPVDRIVTFTSAQGQERISLPDPAFLECHYLMAEILNASGMGELIDRHIEEWEDLKGRVGGGNLSSAGHANLENILCVGLWAQG